MNRQFAHTALHINLQRLLFIRMIVFLCQLAALFYARFFLALELHYALIACILLVLTMMNGALFLRLRSRREPLELEFFIHLLIDILGLSLLLYLAGGANNPFVSYFLVPITIAAATLRWLFTCLISALALCCYSLLLFFYLPLEAMIPASEAIHEHSNTASTPSLHILGMWFNFLVSALLITWFVVKMAAENRHQQERLGQYREETLRNEQILAVATQAAGTAHELGTPLGTMAIVLKDLQLENPDNPALQSDLLTLQEQVENCRHALAQLSRKADFKNLQTETLELHDFLQQLLDQWQLLRPEVPHSYQQQQGQCPMIEIDITLRQALINILDNAADASPQGISIESGWADDNCYIKIRDYGEGLSRELREQLGTQIISTKENGMGVGLILSQATINRLGGSVRLYPMDDVGTLTEISLPLLSTRSKHLV